MTAIIAALAAPFIRRIRTFDQIDLAETPLSTIQFYEPDRCAGIWKRAAALCGLEWMHEIQARLTNRPESSRSIFLSGKWFNLDSLRGTTISVPDRVMAYLQNQSFSKAEPDLVVDDIAVFCPAVKATPTMTSSKK